MPTVTVCTQVYNTAAYLSQCIESVLNQTFQDFEYIIVDNGCTDGSEEIIRSYAERDQRMKVVHFEKNLPEPRWIPVVREMAAGIYMSTLDSDDWWELDYLDRSLKFAQANNLDIACTGTVMHVVMSGETAVRKVDSPLVLPRAAFADYFSRYHVFFRPVWAKLIRMECIRKSRPTPPLAYGSDTAFCFNALRCAERIGIDPLLLHHYRIHPNSISYQYFPMRFDTDVYLYRDAIDFLSAFGPISAHNERFLQAVYANALNDTLHIVDASKLSTAEKLQEYSRITSNPITLAVYRENRDVSVERSRSMLIQLAIKAGLEPDEGDSNGACAIIQELLPRCGLTVNGKNLPLFYQDEALLQDLLADDPEALLRRLLELIGKNLYTKKYSLTTMLQTLAADNPFLCQITDTAFLRRYPKIYLAVWSGDNPQALDEMAGLLLEGRVDGGRETFLKLFISLAAKQNQAPAFVFGKLQLARFYLKKRRFTECRNMVDELEEIGVDNEEMDFLHHELALKSMEGNQET